MIDTMPRSLRTPLLLGALLVGLGLFSTARPALADPYPLDRVVMKLGAFANLDSVNWYWNTVVIDSIPSRDVYLLHLNDPSLQDSMVSTIDPRYAEYCDYDYEGQSAEARHGVIVIAIGGTGGDVEDQGAMVRVRKDDAHAIATGEGALVAILDTGCQLDHPYLAGHFETGYGADFVDHDPDPSEMTNGLDDDEDGLIDEGAGHGTMVAGIVATIAPDARLMPLRVLDDEGRGTVFNVAKALFRAADMGARVVNMSLGTQETSEAIQDAIEQIVAEGVVVLAASGNDSTCVIQYPARDANVLGITATDSLDIKADFANLSFAVDMTAPGVGILSTYLDDGFALGMGTSFSAPFVSGTVALLLEHFPASPPETLRGWVMDGSASIDTIPANYPFKGKLGDGRIDCLGALLVATNPVPVPPASRSPGSATTLSLLQVAPNPATGPFALRFALDRLATVQVRIYSVDGRAVLSKSLGELPAGPHSVPLASRERDGRPLAPGRYVYRIDAGGARGSGTLTILR